MKRVLMVVLYTVAFIVAMLANTHEFWFIYPLVLSLCILAFALGMEGESNRDNK